VTIAKEGLTPQSSFTLQKKSSSTFFLPYVVGGSFQAIGSCAVVGFFAC